MKKILLSITLFLVGIFLCLGTSNVHAQSSIDYNSWDKILNTYVNDQGQVDYDGLKKNRKALDAFIKKNVEKTNISSFSDDEQKAFWINSYNALTLRLIVDNYPLKFGGIRTINWGRPWSIKHKITGKKISLGDIEHKILRHWNPADPRIHFAINCASGGCPKIPNKFFNPAKLDEQLDFETRRFMNDPEKVNLDRSTNTLYHSEILNWFEEDFLAVEPSIKAYILRYLNDDDKQYILNNNVTLDKIKYDWSLNKQ